LAHTVNVGRQREDQSRTLDQAQRVIVQASPAQANFIFDFRVNAKVQDAHSLY
jgi:hypothetical protein